MTLVEYYGEIALPTLLVLVICGIALLFARRRSANSRQFICGATLLTLCVFAAMPLVPTNFRPAIPETIRQQLPPAPKLTLTPTQEGPAAITKISPEQQQNPSSLDLLSIATLVGAAMSLLLALRLVGSLLAVACLRKRARPASPRIGALTEERVRVVESLSSPVALGGFKPVILLPAEAEDWPEDRLRAVLIHEQAHLRNGDPNWQVLAEVACLLHWFNPLAWMVRGAMRREAERAADDAVLQAGVRPSTYAEELVAIAAKMGSARPPIAWTAFARKSGLKSRVQAILTPHIERKPMKRSTKITAIVTLAVATFFVSAYAFQEQVSNPTSFHKDIREGKTVPASAKNGFVGKLADGREVEILQISRKLPNGKIIAWKPDGTPLAEKDRVAYSYRHSLQTLDTHYRYVFIRVPEKKGGSLEPNAGCGSGLHTAFSPSTMIFGGGGILSRKDGFITLVSFISIPKEDGTDIPFGFGITDGPWEDHGPIENGPMHRNVKITEMFSPLPTDEPAIEWAKTFSAKSFTAVEFEALVSERRIGENKIVPVLKPMVGSIAGDQGVYPEGWSHGNYGEYIHADESNGGPRLKSNQKTYLRNRRYFASPKSVFKEFRHLTRPSLNLEVHGAMANPKSGA